MSKADELEEAKKNLKDRYEANRRHIQNYEESECITSNCQVLINKNQAIQTVLQALEDKDKEIEKEHKAAVKYNKEAQKYFDAMMDNERIIDEIDIQNKIIDKMTECILEDTLKLNTFWCAGCLEYVNCKYKRIEECIKEYFRKKVENE